MVKVASQVMELDNCTIDTVTADNLDYLSLFCLGKCIWQFETVKSLFLPLLDWLNERIKGARTVALTVLVAPALRFSLVHQLKNNFKERLDAASL